MLSQLICRERFTELSHLLTCALSFMNHIPDSYRGQGLQFNMIMLMENQEIAAARVTVGSGGRMEMTDSSGLPTGDIVVGQNASTQLIGGFLKSIRDKQSAGFKSPGTNSRYTVLKRRCNK